MTRLAQLLAVLLPCVMACATLESLQEKASQAQREAAAIYDLIVAIRAECEGMQDPRPEVCQSADAVWDSVEATAQRLGVR